jgi:mono/diheme cytochrome c family protein
MPRPSEFFPERGAFLKNIPNKMSCNFLKTLTICTLGGVLLMLQSCQDASGNQTGSEFIPDMAHSIAYEANVYGKMGINTFEKESAFERRQLTKARMPVHGTIPRGATGAGLGSLAQSYGSGVEIRPNGHVPYYYGNTEEERTRAMAELVMNPLPITKAGLAKGKELYTIYCGICHGEKADGQGYLVRDGGKYPAAPANFMLDDHINSTNGRYYHAIMYGRNLMGAYTEKLSYEERWQVIHYIRSLQAQSKKLKYSEEENTLNQGAIPGAKIARTEARMVDTLAVPVETPAEQGSRHSTGEQRNGH